MKKKYQELKGTDVWVYVPEHMTLMANSRNKAKGFVAEIDYKKGITIKHKKTQKDLVCIKKGDNYPCNYKKLFEYVVESIKKGHHNFKKSPDYIESFNPSDCAFE